MLDTMYAVFLNAGRTSTGYIYFPPRQKDQTFSKKDRCFVSPPKVSVVIVAYRAYDVISDCIDSLLRQTYSKEKYEIIIIVDDKETYDVVRKHFSSNTPRMRVEHRTKRGNIPSARNVGVHLSNGEIIAFIDSDCVAHERWLEKICEGFEHFPTVVGVGGAVKPFSLDPVSRALALLNMVSWSGGDRSLKRQLATANAAYRKDILTKMGGFDENASVGEDIDLYYRITQEGHQILYDPEIVVYHKHRMQLRDIFLWCYSSKRKSIYMLKKYRHYLPTVRGIIPALTVSALFASLFIMDLINTLVLASILATLAYIMIFLFFGKKEYFSGRVGAILPIVILAISLGFLFGLIKGYIEYTKSTILPLASINSKIE